MRVGLNEEPAETARPLKTSEDEKEPATTKIKIEEKPWPIKGPVMGQRLGRSRN